MDGRPSIAGRCLIVALAVLASAPVPAVAETYTVTTPDDAGGCAATACASLRAALAVARDGDTIRLPAHGRRYAQQQQGPFVVRASVTIVGDGAGATVIGGDTGRTFVVGDPESRAVPTVVMANLQVAFGHDRYGRGGNILNYGTLTLDHVRVTQGVASRGGGVANVDGGKLTILNSLVDNNVATGSEWSGQGGGVFSDGYVADALVVRDSTVAFNAAESAGGIAVGSPGDQPPNRAALFDRVTIARNHATGASPGGLGIGAESRATLRGSILAANTAEVRSSMRSTAAPIPSNCGVPRPADGGGNLADTDDCGLAREAADPQLSAGLLEGFGQTPVLTIASGSPAVDIGGGCTGSDQRDLRRPQGEACDAGAFEVDAPVIHAGPSGPTADGSPAFVFSSEQPATAFECRLDGPAGAGSWQRCVSPMTYRGLAPGGYTFSVRPVGASAQASRSFTVVATAPQVLRPPPQPGQPAPTPAPTPTPRHRESVVVRPTAGAVKVRLPGTNRYTDLAAVDSIPLGSSIDVRKGRVRLYAIARRGGKPQAASFYGGVFRVAQRGSLIELQLRGPAPRCASGRAAASAAQSEPKRKRKARTRRLWGSGKGRFRTRGRYSAATVRGTTWLVEDRCRSTTTRVRRGAVTVRDFKLRRTVILRKGDRYVARKR